METRSDHRRSLHPEGVGFGIWAFLPIRQAEGLPHTTAWESQAVGPWAHRRITQLKGGAHASLIAGLARAVRAVLCRQSTQSLGPCIRPGFTHRPL